MVAAACGEASEEAWEAWSMRGTGGGRWEMTAARRMVGGGAGGTAGRGGSTATSYMVRCSVNRRSVRQQVR